MPALLAFDTATERMAVALRVGERLWTSEGPGGAQASSDLLPTVRRLLADAGTTLSALDAVAYGRGPGAFTGLRTACAVAQGLALGAGLPVLALDTLRVVAECARHGADRLDVWVAMDARMGDIYAAHQVYSAGEWHTVVAAQLLTPASLLQRWTASPPRAVAGSAVAVYGRQLGLEIPEVDGVQAATAGVSNPAFLRMRPQRDADAWPSPAALDALALAAWRRGDLLDPAEALPHYVRDRVALTTLERDAERAARAAV